MAEAVLWWGAAHELRLMRSRSKNSWPRRHSPFGVPQAPSIKLSSESRQSPEVGPQKPSYHSMQTQLPGMNARRTARRHSRKNWSIWNVKCYLSLSDWIKKAPAASDCVAFRLVKKSLILYHVIAHHYSCRRRRVTLYIYIFINKIIRLW